MIIKKNGKDGIQLNISDYMVFAFLAFGIGAIAREIYRPILLLLGVMWIFFVLPSFKSGKIFLNKAVVCYGLFILFYSMLIFTSKDLGTTVGYLGSYVIYFILYLIPAFYTMMGRIEKMAKICKWILGWITILCIFAILYYQKNPGAARLYISHRHDLDGYMIGGGYQLAYICAMIVPIIFDKIIKKTASFYLVIMAIIMLVNIYMTTSVITMLTVVVGCFVTF